MIAETADRFNPSPPFNRALSSLIDMAWYLEERHEMAGLQTRDGTATIQHFIQRNRHRQVRRSLERLIPLTGGRAA
jgi:hypothetical protein